MFEEAEPLMTAEDFAFYCRKVRELAGSDQISVSLEPLGHSKTSYTPSAAAL